MLRIAYLACALWVLIGCGYDSKTDLLPELALLAGVRPLSSARFSYTGTDKTWTSGICNVQDESTGIGPYYFFVDSYVDDVLITTSSNIWITNSVCDGQNKAEVSVYVDGRRLQTMYYGRCWGQKNPLASTFVVPLGIGYHTMELKYCSYTGRIPQIVGSFPTVMTATSLLSSPNYLGRSTQLLSGTTSLPSSGGFAPINNGSNLSVNFASGNAAILWQNLNLSGMALQNNTSLRNSSFTTEDFNLNDDGDFPISYSTYSSFGGGNFSATAQYNSTGNSIVSRSLYDNAFNLIAFKAPSSTTYGKASISASVNEAAGTLTTLMNIPITRTSDAKYLISFSGNQVQNTNAGGDCEFRLYVNGTHLAGTILSSSNTNQTMGASLFSVETVPAGTAIPVEIRYRRFTGGTCVVDQATLTAIPLE